MKQLKDTQLFVIPVPMDARDFRIVSTSPVEIVYETDKKQEIVYVEIHCAELIGTVTAEHIDFDVEPYVDSEILFGDKYFKDYSLPVDNQQSFSNKDNSFRSLLTSNDVHFTDNEKYLILKPL